MPERDPMMEKLHIWVGLFNFTVLIVFACTGIAVTWPSEAEAPAVRVVDYAPPQGSDKEVADDVLAKLKLPLAGPIPDWAIARDASNVLVLTFYTPNGTHRVTLLEAERKARIEHARSSLGEFLSLMHASTLYGSGPDLRTKLWSLYVDLSIFSLIFMSLSGVWLWIASKRSAWWARASFGLGTALFILLWWVTR